MEILTPFQQQVLRRVGHSSIASNFYLTGDTALAAFLLQHRLSEDLEFFTPDPNAVQLVRGQLEFFTPDPNAVQLVRGQLEQVVLQLGAGLDFSRTFNTFVECFITSPTGERVKLDFAQDTPFCLAPTTLAPEYGLQVDSALDIAANKLAALFGRVAAKDFVDVFFIHHDMMPFRDLLPRAREKHVGMDDYWLAIALRRVKTIELLPRMVKPIQLPTLQAFFLGLADDLMTGIADP